MNKAYIMMGMFFITLSLAMEKPQEEEVTIETDIDFYYDMLDIPKCAHISDIHAAYEIKVHNEIQRHLYAASMLSEALYQIIIYKNRPLQESSPVTRLSIVEKKHLLNKIVYRRLNQLREDHPLIEPEDLDEPFFEGHQQDFELVHEFQENNTYQIEENGPHGPMNAKF